MEDKLFDEIVSSSEEVMKFLIAEAKLMKADGDLDIKLISLISIILGRIVEYIVSNDNSIILSNIKINRMEKIINVIFSRFHAAYGSNLDT